MDGAAKMFGRQLRELRRASGMTQQQLGQAARIDYKHIGSIERGEKSPTLETVEKIARALRADIHDFFGPGINSVDVIQLTTEASRRNPQRPTRAQLEQFFREVVAAIDRIERRA